MKDECDVPNLKPKYEPSNEINLYSYVHQAILMPEDGKIFKYFSILIWYLFIFQHVLQIICLIKMITLKFCQRNLTLLVDQKAEISKIGWCTFFPYELFYEFH